MKKNIFAAGLMAGMAVLVNNAVADSYHYSPYVGADYIYSRAKFNGTHPEYHAGGIYVGSEYGQNFSTELFFNQSGSDTKNFATAKVKTSNRNYGLDVMAYLPFGEKNEFNLIATAGIGEYVFKNTVSGDKHHNDHGYGYRFGGGFKYAFTPNWQTRILARYVKLDQISDFKYTSEYSVGVEYHF